MAEFMIALTHQNVQESLRQLSFSDTPFLLVETMEHEQARRHLVLDHKTYVILDRYDTAQYDLDAYSSGRVFASNGELRWQQEEGNFHIVYIGEKTQADNLKAFKPEAAQPRELQPRSEEAGIFLWGRKIAKERVRTEMHFEETDNIFLELEVPQYLSYPVSAEDNARIRIQTREYEDENGNLQYYRFVTIGSMQ